MRFEAATLVFEDPHAVTMLDRVEKGEERWRTLGMAAGAVVLLVVQSNGEEGLEEHIRKISARKVTPRERKIYAESR
ncbi:MAG TPA: BrnT family toxin [Candidatus Udaeobacter sp.]|nr:BrnT family toxin [Candidatus Udaeobacter sp.]